MGTVLRFPDFQAARERAIAEQLRLRFPPPSFDPDEQARERLEERARYEREEAWVEKMEKLEFARYEREERRDGRAGFWFIVAVLIIILL